jgi:hypothetical protein
VSVMCSVFGARGHSPCCLSPLLFITPPPPFPPPPPSNSHLIADSDGYVCPRSQLDVPSGCCGHAPPATRHACDACDAGAQCCAAYEDCVSCCLAPANGAADLVKTEWRVGGR